MVQPKLGHDLGRIAVNPPATRGRGKPGKLPEGLKRGIERLSGVAMDDVTVHTDSPEPARYRALAYARGAEIFVGPGQEQHLPHEAWHVVQQKQRRVRPTLRSLGAPVNDERALEHEAARMGEQALREPTAPDAGSAAPATQAEPGWSVHAPAQLLVGQTSFNWGIWARGGGSVNSNAHLGAIHDALGRYHPERRATETDQVFSDRRARALDDAQRGVHGYLGAIGDLEHGGLSRDYMLGMADDLQQAHVAHVDHVHRNNLSLYSGEDLNAVDRQQLTADWNEVRGGAGGVRLPAGADNEADNRNTRASFARLMSRPHGRRLVRGILAQPAAPAAQAQPAAQAAQPAAQAAQPQAQAAQPAAPQFQVHVQYTNRLSDEEQGRREANRRAYVPLAAASAAALVRAQQQNTPANLQAYDQRREATMPFLDETRPDFRNTAATEPAAASRANHGANLRVLRGLRDSENFSHRRADAGLIAGSSHIVLGHELVHALHYKTGQLPAAAPANYEHGQALAHWRNPEEHDTIAQGPGVTENDLRGEHAMPARVGHTSKRRAVLDAEERARNVKLGLAAGVGAAAVAYGAYRLLRKT